MEVLTMSTFDNDWENTAFDDASEGFMRSPQEETSPASITQPPDGSKESTEKKGRGALFWFGSAAALVLLVSIIGGGLYWLTRPTIEDQAFMSSPTTEGANPTPPVAVHEDSTTIDLTKLADTSKPVEQAPTSTREQLAMVDRALNEKPEQPKATPNNKPQRESKPTQPAKRVEQPRTQPRMNTPEATAAKEEVENQEYVIQVFSSPSRSDAAEWLQLLREKQVADGRIVEQKIKGESWYRVRFGSFDNRSDAEAQARKLGFRQPWIARVR